MSLQVSGQYTKNARVEAVQSLEISTHLYCGSHVGRQKSTYQSIFPYNMIHNSLIYLAHNSVPNLNWFGPIKAETHCIFL